MDHIIIKDLELTGCHGVGEDEKINPQRFLFSLKLFLDLSKPGTSDDLNDTLDYSYAYSLIKQTFENHSFDLLESMADTIAQSLFQSYPQLKSVEIEIKKPDAPIGGNPPFDYFAVNITRHRK